MAICEPKIGPQTIGVGLLLNAQEVQKGRFVKYLWPSVACKQIIQNPDIEGVFGYA